MIVLNYVAPPIEENIAVYVCVVENKGPLKYKNLLSWLVLHDILCSDVHLSVI